MPAATAKIAKSKSESEILEQVFSAIQLVLAKPEYAGKVFANSAIKFDRGILTIPFNCINAASELDILQKKDLAKKIGAAIEPVVGLTELHTTTIGTAFNIKLRPAFKAAEISP